MRCPMEVIRSYLETINETRAEGYMVSILKTLSPAGTQCSLTYGVIAPLVIIVKSAAKD